MYITHHQCHLLKWKNCEEKELYLFNVCTIILKHNMLAIVSYFIIFIRQTYDLLAHSCKIKIPSFQSIQFNVKTKPDPRPRLQTIASTWHPQSFPTILTMDLLIFDMDISINIYILGQHFLYYYVEILDIFPPSLNIDSVFGMPSTKIHAGTRLLTIWSNYYRHLAAHPVCVCVLLRATVTLVPPSLSFC